MFLDNTGTKLDVENEPILSQVVLGLRGGTGP